MKFVAVPVALVSTMGEPPSTVTVSCTPPTRIANGSSTLAPTTTTASRSNVTKPDSSAVTFRTGRDVEKPIAPVSAGDERRRPVGPRSVTVTPGSTAPC